MASCSSCGGDNSATATRCGYCDQPLAGEKMVEVAWSARTREGASGEGRVVVVAPSSADVQRVRAVAEAAFASSVDALGTGASREQVEADMRERLSSLLPADHPLSSFELTGFEAFVLVGEAAASPPRPVVSGEAVAAAAQSAVKVPIFLVLLLSSLCCLTSGGLCVAFGFSRGAEAADLAKAQVLPAAQAAGAKGLVCVESTVATVDSAIIIPAGPENGPLPCLHVVERVTRTVKETRKVGPKRSDGTRRTTTRNVAKSDSKAYSVASFRLGDLVVKPAETHTEWLSLETFPQRLDGQVKRSWKGLKVETPVTVIGYVQNGAMESGPGKKVYVGPFPTLEATRKSLAESAAAGKLFGLVILGVGVLLLVSTVFAFARRKT